MSRNNDVFQVLVTSGNQAVAVADTAISALSPGQIGVFDANTKLAIDGSAPVREFFLAVGVDDGAGSLGDVHTSAGQVIQSKNIRFYSFREHSAAQPMIFTLSGISANCETEYGIKLEFRNQEIYRTQGYNQFSKTYVVKTGCCDECPDGCPDGDGNEVVKLLKAEINLDELGLASAIAIAADTITIATHGTSANYSPGDEVSDADVDVIIAFNSTAADADKVFTSLQVTTNPMAINNYCKVNLKYFYPRQTVVVPSLVEGFTCTGTLTTTQEAAFEEGSGYDIQRLEYEAGGWNGRPGPYRLLSLTGIANENIEYFADKTAKYCKISLTYDQFSVGGWQEYLNNLCTIVAVPEADTTTRDGLIAVLDGLITPFGFDALADDAAAATTTLTTVSPTADIDDVTLDGIA